MEAVVHVTPEIAGAMKPRAGADENVTAEPFRSVITGGSACIRSDIIVAVGAFRGYADCDADLSFGPGNDRHKARCCNSSYQGNLVSTHAFTSP
jgi:hypothetical protein